MKTLQQVIKQRQDDRENDLYEFIYQTMFNMPNGVDNIRKKFDEIVKKDSFHNQETVVAILEAVKEWAEKQDGFELGEKVFFHQISRIDLLYFLSSTLQEIKNQK